MFRQIPKIKKRGKFAIKPTVEKKSISKIVGQNLRLLRLKNNVKQFQLADFLGISANTLSRVERGDISLSLEKIQILCDYFETTPNYFFYGEEENFKTDHDNDQVLQIIDTLINQLSYYSHQLEKEKRTDKNLKVLNFK